MTVISRHLCFADGSTQPGSALDCLRCRAALEQSVELARSEGTFTGDSPIGDSAKTHDTVADTVPDDPGPGGLWTVSCSCGWQRSGYYVRNSGEPIALRLARLMGHRHEECPEENHTPEGGPS